MSCGAIAWWRDPDFAGLLERHGQVEHLVVQFDFLAQVQRDGRAEYSIPGASKSGSGKTGYADIVSIATREIWEIKPRSLEADAFREAAKYVVYAKVSCGPNWKAGELFTTSNLFGGGGVVYRLEGNGNRAELIAQQGRPGVVIYFWRINGKEVPSLTPYFAWAIRQQIIADYFSAGQPPQPLPGSKPPNNFPPVKFKPPVLWPDGCIPQLLKFLPAVSDSIRTTCAQTVMENSSVAVLLEAAVFNSLVGPGLVANQISMLQVKGADPTVTLYRETLMVLSAAAAANGIVGIAIGLAYALPIILAGAVELVGAAIVFTCRAVAPAVGATALTTEGLLGTFVASLRSASALRPAMAVGAGLLGFAIPRASRADPSKPVAIDVSFPKFILVKPGGAQPRVGQTSTIDGAEWFVAAVSRTGPD